MLPVMKRLLIAVSAALALTGLSACSDDSSSSDSNADGPTAIANFEGGTETTTTATGDVEYLTENLPITAGNVVITVNNGRSQYGAEEAGPGGVYDVGSYYDELTAECKTKITRSEFRQDFIDRVIPMIAEESPERVTVTVDGDEAVARIEQVTGTTILMTFVVDGALEEHACNDDGTIAITAA